MNNYLKQLTLASQVAIDTETNPDGSIWSLQFSHTPGTSAFVQADQTRLISFLREQFARPDLLTIVHNALFDLPVLRQLDIVPAKTADLMVLCYILQTEPLGLKTLAFRHLGKTMRSYSDMVAHATHLHAMKYLARAVEQTWPDPDLLVWKEAGTWKKKQPQNIGKKIARILGDVEFHGADPYERWGKISQEEGKKEVEEMFGPMPVGSLRDIPRDEAVYYGNCDSDATLRIFRLLWPRLVDEGLEDAFWADMESMPMAEDMMRNGILPDIPYLQSLGGYFEERLKATEADVTEKTGYQINLASPDQVAILLYNYLGITCPKKTKKGKDSTAEPVLSRIVSEHPAVQLVRDYREISKLKSTYTDQLPSFVAPDGRIHTTIRLTNTSTGRYSMASPNLQQIPSKKEEGRKVKSGFIAAPGHKLISCDESQLELRILAHFSEDPIMLDVYRTGGDIHMRTACEVFGKKPEDIDKHLERKPSKNVNFLTVYGGGAKKLRETLLRDNIDWSVDTCEHFISRWKGVYKKVATYMDDVHRLARMNGYVTTLLGRRRYVPAVKAKSQWLQFEALRQAGNLPIQGTAADIMKVAMADLWWWVLQFRKQGYSVKPLLQIHDDLVTEVEDRLVDRYAQTVKFVMENAVTLKVPLVADPEVGDRWYPMGEWKKGGIDGSI